MLRPVLMVVGAVVLCLAASPAARAQHDGGAMGHDDVETGEVRGRHERLRSPGLAVALSLTPVPVDFGNLYAENIGWGVAYTTAQLALAVPMMWIGGSHMGMGSSRYSGANSSSWSVPDRNAMIALVSGYVAVKIVAGLHAGYSVRAYNREQRGGGRVSAMVVPAAGGALAFAALRF